MIFRGKKRMVVFSFFEKKKKRCLSWRKRKLMEVSLNSLNSNVLHTPFLLRYLILVYFRCRKKGQYYYSSTITSKKRFFILAYSFYVKSFHLLSKRLSIRQKYQDLGLSVHSNSHKTDYNALFELMYIFTYICIITAISWR